jgi:5'-nucleotidase/UDP-sugar diphosphatase
MKKSSILGLSFAVVGLVALSALAERFVRTNETLGGDANSYALNLTSSNAPSDFSSYSVLTSASNTIEMTFSGGAASTGKFCSLASGEYLENKTPINTLYSITAAFTGTLDITFGKFDLAGASFSGSSGSYTGFKSTLTSGTVYTFTTLPSFFRLTASAATVIESVVINYRCPSVQTPVSIKAARDINAEDAYCYSKGVVTRMVNQKTFYAQYPESDTVAYGIEIQRQVTSPTVSVGDSIDFEGILSIAYSRFRVRNCNIKVHNDTPYASPVPLQVNEGNFTLANMTGNDGRLVSLSNISNNSITSVATSTTYTFLHGSNNLTLYIKTSDTTNITNFNTMLAGMSATERLRYKGVVVIHNSVLEIILTNTTLDFEVYDTAVITGYYLTGSINSWDKRDPELAFASVSKPEGASWDERYTFSKALAVNDVVKGVKSDDTTESNWIWFGYSGDDSGYNVGLSNAASEASNITAGDYSNIKIVTAGTYTFLITLTGTTYDFTITSDITPSGEDKTLDIFAVNDTHGTIVENSSNYEPGMAKLAGFINAERVAAGGVDKTVLLSSGDMWQGSLDSNITKGAMMVDMMKAMKFDSMTIGNHEFDWGKSQIETNITRAADTTDGAWGYPTLGINIKDTTTGEYILGSPSTTFTRNDLTVSIIGAIGEIESQIATDVLGNIDFVDPTDLVKTEATRLRTAGSDIIIYSVHNGAATAGANDYPDASLADYVDCVFTSHTHRTEAYTITSTSTSRSIPVVQSWCNGKKVGHVKLNYNTGTEAVTTLTYENSDNVVDASPTADTGITSIYNTYQTTSYTDGPLSATIASMKSTVLGNIASTSSYVSSGTISQNNVNKLYTKAQLDMYSADDPVLSYNNASRTSWSVGDITYADIYKAFPFDNQTYVVTATGAQIKYLDGNGYGWLGNESAYTLKDGVTSASLVDATVYTIVTTSYAITNYNYEYTAETRIDSSSSHSQRHILYNAFIANPSRFN